MKTHNYFYIFALNTLFMSLRKFIFSLAFVEQVVFALIIIAVTLFSFIYWLGFTTNHGQEIVVPNLSKMTIEQAERKLNDLNLEYELLDTVDYDSKFPKLAIVHQDPTAGAKVKENRIIYIKINSSGYSNVQVPDLVQKTYRQAVPTLKAIGLEIGDTVYVPNLARDMVLEMKSNGRQIKAGERIMKMSKIDLVLGDGKTGFEDPDAEKVDVQQQQTKNIDTITYQNK
jgi:eukaryotic-like serine/threonine-protein kinase